MARTPRAMLIYIVCAVGLHLVSVRVRQLNEPRQGGGYLRAFTRNETRQLI